MIRKKPSVASSSKKLKTSQKLILDLFLNRILKKGKKSVAKKLFLNTLKYLKYLQPKLNPFIILETAIKKVLPTIELKTQYLEENLIYKPNFINKYKAFNYAIKVILQISFTHSIKNYSKKLAKELLETFLGKSKSIKKKEEMFKDIEKLKNLDLETLQNLYISLNYTKTKFSECHVKFYNFQNFVKYKKK
uniref:Ribosomal protein S7 n=1 Tax=Spumella sp. NIES-1846 TaxID=2490549 RepID=A0A455RFZ4_9STRA|nr:ribosomal protein S7 [Spumella sp. NIES-1846]